MKRLSILLALGVLVTLAACTTTPPVPHATLADCAKIEAVTWQPTKSIDSGFPSGTISKAEGIAETCKYQKNLLSQVDFDEKYRPR